MIPNRERHLAICVMVKGFTPAPLAIAMKGLGDMTSAMGKAKWHSLKV